LVELHKACARGIHRLDAELLNELARGRASVLRDEGENLPEGSVQLAHDRPATVAEVHDDRLLRDIEGHFDVLTMLSGERGKDQEPIRILSRLESCEYLHDYLVGPRDI